MQYKLPPIGSKGVYTLYAPLENYLDGRTHLECVTVRSFGEIIASGRDPYQHYYQPLGIDESYYKEHSKHGGHVVSLRTESGKYYHIPSPYIKSFPLIGGVAYLGLALVSTLGALPLGMSLDHIKEEVDDLIKSLLGVTANTDFAAITETEYLTKERHDALESARKAKITETTSSTARINDLVRQVETLSQENEAMREYIESKL